jgi:hypothetical protein
MQTDDLVTIGRVLTLGLCVSNLLHRWPLDALDESIEYPLHHNVHTLGVIDLRAIKTHGYHTRHAIVVQGKGKKTIITMGHGYPVNPEFGYSTGLDTHFLCPLKVREVFLGGLRDLDACNLLRILVITA